MRQHHKMAETTHTLNLQFMMQNETL